MNVAGFQKEFGFNVSYSVLEDSASLKIERKIL
jgi:hypothetical protein